MISIDFTAELQLLVNHFTHTLYQTSTVMTDNTESSTSTKAADDAFPDFLSLFEPTEENVCEFGDINLVADDGFHPPSKIRISSCILASSSKPFKALFSKKFSEGFVADMRNAAAPHEVQIQDPPKPLSHLCRLLHHKPVVQDLARRLNGDLSASEMLDLAVIADVSAFPEGRRTAR